MKRSSNVRTSVVLFVGVLSCVTLLLAACARRNQPIEQAPQYVTHTVKYSGETLGAIAAWYTGSSINWKEIANANPGLRVKAIRVGDVINIPQAMVTRNEPFPAEQIQGEPTVAKNEAESVTPPGTPQAATAEVSAVLETAVPEAAATEVSVNVKLAQAVAYMDLAETQTLLKAGGDANFKENGRPLLSWAAQNGSAEIVQALIDSGADLNAADAIGHTALMRATDMDKRDVAAVLLKAKADPNAESQNGDTALSLAIQSGYGDMVKLLVEGGADVNLSTKEGDSYVLAAAQSGNLEIVSILGAAKADMNRSNAAYTPLIYAIEQGNKDLVSTLLKNGADPNARTNSGQIPLSRALDSPEIVALLLEAKADPNNITDSGETLLMRAVQDDALASVEALIKAGADVNKKGRGEQTPLGYAQSMMKAEIAEVLKKHGAVE